MAETHATKAAPARRKLAAIRVVLNGRLAATTCIEPGASPADLTLPQPLTRVQENLLAKPERLALDWLCARMPARVTPDHLTGIGFIGTLLIVIGYGLSPFGTGWLLLAIAGYAVNWFGDSLDGSLARFRRIERPNFGYFIDHSLDAVGNLLTMVGLGLTNFVRMDTALFAAGCYLLLSVHTFLAARVVGTFRLSYGLLGPTELRLILITMSAIMYVLGASVPRLFGYSVFDTFTIAAAFLLLVIFTKQTVELARTLHQSETVR